MTITIDDVFTELRPRIESAFNGVAVSKHGNHITLVSQDKSGKEVKTKINFHPEIPKSNNNETPRQVSDHVFLYSANSFPRPACVNIDLGIAQISGSMTATRYPIIKGENGALDAAWDTIAQGAIRNLKRKITAPTTP